MSTYTQSRNALDEIAARVAGCQNKYDNYGSSIQSCIDTLNAIVTDYADVIATLNAYAGSDEAWLNLVAERANMQADFLALRTDLEALQTAYNNI